MRLIQLIGNVIFFLIIIFILVRACIFSMYMKIACIHTKNPHALYIHFICTNQTKKKSSLQFQQRQICIAIVSPVFALLSDVVLKHGGCFGVVSVETVEDGIDVLWSVGRGVEGDAHCCEEVGEERTESERKKKKKQKRFF